MPPIITKPVRDAMMQMLATQHEEPVMQTAYDQLRVTERKFVDVFIATDNPMKAIIAASPSLESNHSVARVRAADMLKRPLVQAAIAQKLKQFAERYDITANALYNELAKTAKIDVRDYVRLDPEGRLVLDLTQTSDEAWGAISGFEMVGGQLMPKFHDKMRATEMIIKMQGLYAPVGINMNVNGSLTVNSEPVKENMSAEEAAEFYQRSLEE